MQDSEKCSSDILCQSSHDPTDSYLDVVNLAIC